MARSLDAAHHETPSTNPLLTGFLLIAVGWLLVHAFSIVAADATLQAGPTAEIGR